MSAANQGYQGRILKGAALGAINTAAASSAPQPPSAQELAESEARRKADEIIHEARMEADRIINDAHGHASYLTSQARHEADEQLSHRLTHLSRNFRNEIESIQPRLVSIVIDAVADIIGLVPDEDLVDRLIMTALKDIDRRAAVTLYTSSAQLSAAQSLLARIKQSGESQIEHIETDTQLPDGTFRLEANGVSTEIGVDSQLSVLERILSGAEPDHHHSPNEDL